METKNLGYVESTSTEENSLEDDRGKDPKNEGQGEEKLAERKAWQEQEERKWQEQEEQKWLKEDLAGHLENHVQEEDESEQPYISNDQGDDDEDEKDYVNESIVKKEEASDNSDDQGDDMDDEDYCVHGSKVKNEDPDFKPSIGDMRLSWEKKFVLLMNKIESFEAIPLEHRTDEQQNTLKKLRKKYHKKKIKYPHLARASLSAAPKKMVKPKFHKINKKSEGSKILPSSQVCFGSGSLESPMVKFYFTAPCPQLGIEAGSEPSLAGRPAFMASQQGFTCRLCELEVSSGVELVEHWQWEMERQGEVLGGEEVLEVPHAEVRPAQEDIGSYNGLVKPIKEDMKVNMNVEVKMEVTDGDSYECSKCEFKSPKIANLKKHVQRVHRDPSDIANDEVLQCENCEYKCTKKDTMRMHRHRNHKEGSDIKEEQTFYCDVCDYTCTKKDTLRMHKSVKHRGKLSKCDKCEYSCTKNEVLVMHKFRKHGGPEPPKKLCDQCDFSCFTSGGLRFHKNSEHLGLEDPQDVQGWTQETEHGMFECDQCDYKANKKDTLRRHRNRDHGTMNGKNGSSLVQCDECEYSCVKAKVLAMHKFKKHGGILPKPDYVCNLCEYNCSKREVFDMHLYKHHDGAPPERKVCDMCSFSTNWSHTLRKHRERQHLGIVKTFHCPQCEFTAMSRGVVDNHEHLKHGKEASFMCDLCDFRTSNAPYLKTHMKGNHSEEFFYCDQCDFKTSHKQSVKNHARIHDETCWFQCEFCEYRTAAKGNLKQHTEAKHMGIRHPCPECEFVGYLKSDLKKHNDAMHLGIAPSIFKCDYCEYSHSNSKQVEKHQIGRHTNIKFACPHCAYTTNWSSDLYKHSKGQGSCGGPCGPLPKNYSRVCMVLPPASGEETLS